jgi:calcium/calmodulin-dependent protein kinase I
MAAHHYRLTFPNQNGGDVEDFYHLQEELGSGAFSVVVKAHHKKSGDIVAIKQVDKEQTDAEEMYNELNIMSQLVHSNLVTFKEIFEGPDKFYVVLELVTGGELFDRIIELQRYSEKEAVHVMLQALSGLKHMHDNRIAHRDLKPENLLLSSKEPHANVKVADFGFATKVTNDNELLQIVGTFPYFAPELSALRDESITEGYGRPVDVWAMGVILYILLSGIHPFQIADEDLMLDNIQNAKWDWVGPNWSKISMDAKDLIRNMLAKNPAQRYTINQCLTHKWLTAGMQHTEELGSVAEAIKLLQAKKRLKGAMQAVLAQQKMKRLLLLRPAPPKTKLTKIVIKALQGKDLAPKDSNGKSDPYLIILYGNQQFKTKCIKKTLNPVWTDQTFVIAADPNIPEILVECWDYDRVGTHDFMGEFFVPVNNIPEDGTPVKKDYELELTKTKNKAKKTTHVSGTIELEVFKAL